MGAFANPFDADKLLWNGCPCGQHRSIIEHNMAQARLKGKDASRFMCEDVEDGVVSAEARPVHSIANCFDPECAEAACVAMRQSAEANGQGDMVRAVQKHQRDLEALDAEPEASDLEGSMARAVESAVDRKSVV